MVFLAHLAGEADGGPHNARELAAQSNLPLPVVSKILKHLTHQSLLVSQRGAKGGYGLARPPRHISVSEIIAALEGPIAPPRGTLGPGHCDQESVCALRSPWQRINQVIGDALGRLTLAELAHPLPEDWLPFAEPREDPARLQLPAKG